MSDVEAQLRKDMGRALGSLARAAQHVGELFATYVPEPDRAEQPERFDHRDVDGDRVLVYPHDYPEFQSLLMVETDSDSVRLSQDAVNRLAQYLDRYRTDQQDCDAEDVSVREHWCGSDSDHAEHTHGRQDNPARCLGCYRSHYGVTKDMT